MTLLIVLALLVAYMAVGYLVFVPRVVANITEELIAEWDREAKRRADDANDTLQLVVSYRDVSHEERRSYLARHRVEPEPAPVDELRRKAARTWPMWALIWLPAVIAMLIADAYALSVRHAASRAPRSCQEIEQDNAAKSARIAELERELRIGEQP